MEKITGPKIKVGLKVTAELHRTAKSEAARRGMSVERAYEQALENWVAGTAQGGESSASRPNAPISAAMVPVVEWFLDWMSTTSTPEVEILKDSIRKWSAARSVDLRKKGDKRNKVAS